MNSQPALFLDRDGVINRRIVDGYVTTPEEFVLDEAILPLLGMVREAGHIIVVITNQQGVGKGLMSQADLDEVHRHMNQQLTERLGFGVDHIYSCTSLASANDPRRKPSPGMLLEAIAEHNIDPGSSWFVGDSRSDAAAGRAAGVQTVLIGPYAVGEADIVVPSMNEAVDAIAGNLTRRKDV